MHRILPAAAVAVLLLIAPVTPAGLGLIDDSLTREDPADRGADEESPERLGDSVLKQPGAEMSPKLPTPNCSTVQPNIGGCEEWRTDLPAGGHPFFRAPPLKTLLGPDDDRIYFLTGGSNGTLTIGFVDATTGQLETVRGLDTDHNETVHPGTLALGPDGQVLAATEDSFGTLFSVNLSLDEVNWKRSPVWGSRVVPGPDNQIYAANNKTVVALDARSGDTLWQTSLPGAGPVALEAGPKGQRVYASTFTLGPGPDWKGIPGNVTAYDAGNGQEIWRVNLNETFPETVYLLQPWQEAWEIEASPSGDRIYLLLQAYPGIAARLLAEGPSLVVEARDAKNGERIWRRNYMDQPQVVPGEGFGPVELEVGPDGDRIYTTTTVPGIGYYGAFLDSDIMVQGYQAASGILLWEQREASPWLGLDGHAALEVAPDGEDLYLGAGFGCARNWYTDRYDCYDRNQATGFTVKYNSITGVPAWKSTTQTDPGCVNGLDDMAVGEDGASLFSVGWESCSGDAEGYLLSQGTGEDG